MNGYDAIHSGLNTLQGEIAIACGIEYEDVVYIGCGEYTIDGMPWFEWSAAVLRDSGEK